MPILQVNANKDNLDNLAGSATTGIPLGTWASFEGDYAPNIEWLRGGTSFNANTYPALAIYLGGTRVPARFDHNRPSEAELIQDTLIAPMTMQYDADLLIAIGTSEASRYITVNGERASGEITSSGTIEQITISVKKGDVVVCTGSNNPSDWKVYATYYKHPMFIKATPTSSDSDYEGTLNGIRTYVDNNTQPKSKVWVGALPDTGATALNIVGIVIPNASKATSVGFQTIHRDGQSDPMQYVYVDLVNNASFRINFGLFNMYVIVNGTYDATNDTWTITSRTATSLGFTTMKVNYSEDVIVKSS